MISLFYYLTKWLGWIPDRGAQLRAIGLMVVGGLIGTFIPYFVDGSFVLSAVGLPFGVFGGILLFIGVQGLLAQSEGSEPSTLEPLLLVGVFGAFIGHFLEVHFVFSIAATYTYFWAYLGLAVAMAAIKRDPMAEVEPGSSTISEPEETETRRESRSRRRRRGGRNQSGRTAAGSRGSLQENWETWILAQGLAMSIIFIILTFDFVPVQFDISTGNYSIVWLMSITYLVGTAIIFSELAIKQAMWQKMVNWGRAILLYAVTSIGYAGFYILVHSQQRAFLTSGRVQQGVTDQVDLALRAAGALVNLLGGFYIFLFLLMLVIAFALMQGHQRGLRLWRSNNLLIYVPLIVAMVLVIFFKNFNVVKADIYLKEGDRYRSQQLWDQAEALHQAAIAADSDEDFYYLMLALDYQMKAQDGRLSQEVRRQAWLEGERIALQARDINKYNPDNTGNLGRYYFTLGQVLDRSYYNSAIEYFEKAIQLAPQNVVYYNLLGQVHYVQSNFAEAIGWLEESAELDPLYEPTYILLGDTYAAQGEVDGALAAHQEAIRLSPNSFTDANFDTRLNFYVSRSAPQGNPTEALTDTQELETPPAPEVGERPVDKLIDAFEDYAAGHPEVAQTYWAIGHIYSRMNDLNSAQNYFEQALNIQSDNQRQQRANQQVNNRVAQSLVQIGNAYLNEENYENAEQVYNQALSITPNQAEAWSSLGFIYARTERVQEAIQANQRVLEIRPNDYSSLKNLALLYQQVGELAQAVAYTEQALTQAPEAERESLETFLTQLQAQQSGGTSTP
jgi:tetratricopeptide (TPR) repeat protein